MKKLLQLPLPELSVCADGGQGGGPGEALRLTTVLLRQILTPLFFSISAIERMKRLNRLPRLQSADWKAAGGVPFKGWVDGRQATVGVEGSVVAPECAERSSQVEAGDMCVGGVGRGEGGRGSWRCEGAPYTPV